MDADKAWSVAQRLAGTQLQKWTKDGRGGKPFTFRIRDKGKGPGIGFFRGGRETKQASFDRFRSVYTEWRVGNKSADWFTNNGAKESEMKVARFLIPVFELVERAEESK